MVNDTRISDEVLEAIADFLSLDIDEVQLVNCFQRPDEISSQWHESTRDLSHLSRDEKQSILRRDGKARFRPRMVGDVPVHLFNDVQTEKGKARVKVAVVDLGDRCLVASF